MASVFDVANAFLDKEEMTPKKLQKLTYYYYAWGWALYHKKMIDNTCFEAWVHGPVSPAIYNKYKRYGWNNITDKEEYSLTEKEKDLLDSVWITYGHLSGNELEALTHNETPWINARKNCGEYQRSNNEISPDDMEQYYIEQYIGD